ncbi:hydroxyethylthiazole kinase [Halomonas caseinilytica]|uniref:Hydroxyethylthiazole kinase n=1 Tax=Halomonas caseinilytica TaxID=438744 RepID=A0A1M7AP41_9GAMM|nr:hydroxyethylthiazole kinase [Halomonas caseinilytica]SEN30093.1 hydroxyethylthiazole kinase [Halomonas caseinilytica]SHL44435.1 hydroxyethylthiazole kinase [Halomonas caseinilytica]
MHTIDLAHHLGRVRETRPLVHNITNHVAMNTMANVLLAHGASPAMAHAREEVGEFAALAGAVTLNIGTLSPDWVNAMEDAARAATDAGTPWVLDPVAVGATALRREAGARLLALSPTAVRGNASEIMALAEQGRGGQGVDSTDTTEAAERAAVVLARRTGAVVAVTGETDLVTDGKRLARVAGGHALMPLVTTLGCALTGVVGAHLAIGEEPFDACVAALASYAVAGSIAGEHASGPGSFAVAFLDALHALDANTLTARAQLEITHAT